MTPEEQARLKQSINDIAAILYRTHLGSNPLFESSLPIWISLAFVANSHNSSTVETLWLLD
jgi:hypothetical protein